MLMLGVVGYPIKHSLSPVMHRAAMEHLGIEGVYLPFEVKPGELEIAVRGAKALGFKGLNITIPYKEDVLKVVDPDERAARIGAVNTVDLENLRGYNTDCSGAMRALEENGVEIDGITALVVGAGGAGKAVAYGLLERNATVILSNRTEERGRRVAEMLRKYGTCIFYPYNRIHELKGKVELIVNATPLGMKGFEAKLPVPATLLENVTVFDTVYNPPRTPLIAEAEKRGCKVVYGVDMLVYQGAEAFEIWSNRKAPVEVMFRAVRESLDFQV